MKILHIVAGMDPSHGGVCQAIRATIQGLVLIGNHHNEVACLDAPGAGYLVEDPFTIHPLGPSRGPWGYAKKLLPWLLENLYGFDAVIIHGLWLYPSHAVARAFRMLKTKGGGRLPVLHVMPHGMLDPYFQRDRSRKIKAFRNWVYWKLLENKVINRANGVLFTCEEEKLLARQPFQPYQPAKESVVGLGVEEPPALNDRMQAAFHAGVPELNGRPFILFLSRIHPKKGLDLLIRAYSENGAAFLSMPDLVIAGPLDSDYAAQMRQLAAASGRRIHFAGMLRGDEKWGAIHSCEAFVLPSHQENFGIAVVEALACGKPVLISNRVNIWREIQESGAGIISTDDLHGTKEALARWCAMPQTERMRMSDMAVACYIRHFRIPAAAASLQEALQ